MSEPHLFSLQGYIRIATRLPSGKAGKSWWAGNVPEATLELGAEFARKTESFTGGRTPYGKRKTSQTGRFTGTFDEWSAKNLALGLHSAVLATATGTVTGEVLPGGLAVGDQVRLDHPYASDLVLTDSTGSPVTVDIDDYELVGHNANVIDILGLGSPAYVQPLRAAYDYEAYSSLEVFAEEPEEVFVIFDGIDTETNSPVLIDLFRTSFDPFTNFALINAEYGSLPFGADVLYDPLNALPSGKGGFAKIRQKAAAP